MVNGTVYPRERDVTGQRAPLTYEDLARIAESLKKLGRVIKIRTRNGGEVVYESDRGRWPACQR
jgi:ParB-like chromosome segregation protein Spo0J